MPFRLAFFLVVNTLNVFVVQKILDGFVVSGGWTGFIIAGVIIGLLNSFLKPILKVLSLPFIFLTAGLFLIVVNAVILWFAELLISFLDVAGVSLTITGIGTYIAAVVLFGVINYLFQKVLR